MSSMLTNRDIKVIDFLEKYKIAKLTTIQNLFFPSLRTAQLRMKKLHDKKVVKREKDIYSSEYMYYIRKPSQVKHSLIIADVLGRINNMNSIEIIKFDNEFTINNIRSDFFIAYKYKKTGFIALGEVELSNNNIQKKTEKYEQLFINKTYKGVLPVFPKIIFVTDRKLPTCKHFEIIQIKENLSNLNKIFA